jgi:hypothetical protein
MRSWAAAPEGNDAEEEADLDEAQRAFNKAVARVTHGKINERDIKKDEQEERRQRFEANVLEALKDIADSLRNQNAVGQQSVVPFSYTEDYDEF